MTEKGPGFMGKKHEGNPSWMIFKNESQEAGRIMVGVEVMLSRITNSKTSGTA